jgi:hypothetical protein
VKPTQPGPEDWPERVTLNTKTGAITTEDGHTHSAGHFTKPAPPPPPPAPGAPTSPPETKPEKPEKPAAKTAAKRPAASPRTPHPRRHVRAIIRDMGAEPRP